MAITSYFYQLLIHLKKNKLIDFQQTKSILEIGEQNWYGDVKLEDLLSTVKDYSEKEKVKKLLVILISGLLCKKYYLI